MLFSQKDRRFGSLSDHNFNQTTKFNNRIADFNLFAIHPSLEV